MSNPSARLQLIPGDVPPADPRAAEGLATPAPELFELVRAMARADVAAAWARHDADAAAEARRRPSRRRG